MGLHAFGTPSVLFSKGYSGFQIAIPAGLLVSAAFALPPLGGQDSEAARGRLLTVIAVVGTIAYVVSAARYWHIFRKARKLLPAAVVACFLLLAEAMIGVAATGERKWHASWWEWHSLIVAA
jgi:adenylate cyclase